MDIRTALEKLDEADYTVRDYIYESKEFKNVYDPTGSMSVHTINNYDEFSIDVTLIDLWDKTTKINIKVGLGED